MKKKLGTSTLAAVSVDFSRNKENVIPLYGKPFLTITQNEKSIIMAVSDYQTLNGFFVSFTFAKVPDKEKAWHGAAKCVALEVARALKNSSINAVTFSPVGTQKINPAMKSGLEYLTKKGIKIK